MAKKLCLIGYKIQLFFSKFVLCFTTDKRRSTTLHYLVDVGISCIRILIIHEIQYSNIYTLFKRITLMYKMLCKNETKKMWTTAQLPRSFLFACLIYRWELRWTFPLNKPVQFHKWKQADFLTVAWPSDKGVGLEIRRSRIQSLQLANGLDSFSGCHEFFGFPTEILKQQFCLSPDS